jgi:hypothetical protein
MEGKTELGKVHRKSRNIEESEGTEKEDRK